MKYFTGHVRTNKIGSDCTFEFEVEDNATEEEIEKTGRDALWESGSVEWWYEEDK